MSNRSVITLRVASELKDRLAIMAQSEGVSMNQLISYFLTESVTAMEMRQRIEARRKRIEGKSEDELRAAALAAFDKLKARQAERQAEIEIPEWDRWPEEGEEILEELITEEILAKFVKVRDAKSRDKTHTRYQPSSQPSLAVHEPEAQYKADQDDSD